MNQALEPVRTSRERIGSQTRARWHAGRLEKLLRVHTFRHWLEPDQNVDVGHAAAAKRGHLGERVELTAPVGRGDRPAGVQLQMPGSEPPRGRLPLRDELLDELVERNVAVLDARSRAEHGVEAFGVAIVEYLHAPVDGASPRGCRRYERDEDRTDRRHEGRMSRAHLGSCPVVECLRVFDPDSRVKPHTGGASVFPPGRIRMCERESLSVLSPACVRSPPSPASYRLWPSRSRSPRAVTTWIRGAAARSTSLPPLPMPATSCATSVAIASRCTRSSARRPTRTA